MSMCGVYLLDDSFEMSIYFRCILLIEADQSFMLFNCVTPTIPTFFVVYYLDECKCV